MPKYRKKPVVIEAVQFTGEHNFPEIVSFFGEKFGSDFYYNPQKDGYFIKTIEGDMKVSLGDYIIKGVDGEFYPCKPDIFAKTYEEVTDNAE